MLHISLFSGIGGFDLASEWIGWKNIASCEINPFGRKVLEYYWPTAYHHDDIKTLTYEKINQELTARFGHNWRSDDIILTGGFPCQPYSMAGKRLGTEDERHLWPEMLRVIREVSPKWIVGENVFGLVNWSNGLVFHEVQTDLEALWYEVQSYVLPACGVNAPHRRDRIFIIAHANNKGGGGRFGKVQGENGEVPERNNDAEFGNASNQRTTTDTQCIGHTRRTETTGNDNTERIGRMDTDGGWNGNEIRSEVERCGSIIADSKLCSNRLSTKRGMEMERNILEGQEWQKKTNRFNFDNSRSNFNNFPTQSPICTRNDGISAQLDGITFPKWRNESIKAGGNAVVPPLIYNIFKTIQQYEDDTRNNIQPC